MPYYFTPPTAPTVPTVVRRSHPSYDLFKHYRPWSAGINIWITVADVVTTVEPPQDQIAFAYLGSHMYEIDEPQAELLAEAGYDVTFTGLFGYGMSRYGSGAYGGAA